MVDRTVTFHVVGGGRNADGPVWYVVRRDDLYEFVVAEAPTREKARAKARTLKAEAARLSAGDKAEAPLYTTSDWEKGDID